MLELRDLHVHFSVAGGRTLRAVNGVSLSIGKGEALGLVGESGSGKSTIGKAALHLVEASGGEIRINDQDATKLDRSDQGWLRRTAQIVFQDPHSALNPRMTIFRSIAEPLILHTTLRGAELRKRVGELAEVVGLPGQFMYRYPHELSGGQKQRVCIARAIALNPQLLVLDEPTSALDVSVQAQILEFLKQLQSDLGLTYLFISHNLAVVRAICNRVAVLYLGSVVEEGETEAVFNTPKHPYTDALLRAVPFPAARQPDRGTPLSGEIPSPVDLPPGCGFYSRCSRRELGICDKKMPHPTQFGTYQKVRCYYPIGKAVGQSF